MVDLVVLRGDGSSQGEDVIDALLTSTNAALSRGRVELDDASGLRSLTKTCVYRDGLLPGDLAELYDVRSGEQTIGKVTSITHDVTTTEIVTTLKVVVPSELPV